MMGLCCRALASDGMESFDWWFMSQFELYGWGSSYVVFVYQSKFGLRAGPTVYLRTGRVLCLGSCNLRLDLGATFRLRESVYNGSLELAR